MGIANRNRQVFLLPGQGPYSLLDMVPLSAYLSIAYLASLDSRTAGQLLGGDRCHHAAGIAQTPFRADLGCLYYRDLERPAARSDENEGFQRWKLWARQGTT